MKKSFLAAGMAIIASLFMISCENKGGGSITPDKSSAKLWPRYDENAKQWGYMNADGDFAFNARFSEVYEFSGNYALARTGNVLEFIKADGNRVSGAPSFNDIAECSGVFMNGYLRYKQNGYWGLLNSQLKIALDPNYAELGEMGDNGLISYKRNQSDLFGYIDINNKPKVDPIYAEANTFIDGVAVVKRGDSYSAISPSSTVIYPKYPRLASLGNERISYFDDARQKYGLMDLQGNEIGSPIYEIINPFTDNGRALIKIDGKYSYIDKTGSEINLSNGKAVDATDFHEGIAFVKYLENGDFEAIGTDGTRKFYLNKGEVPYGNFHNGLCLVWLKNDKGQVFYRYINTSGSSVRDWINGQPAFAPIKQPGITPSNPTNPDTYYIKHPWAGGEWTWKQMTKSGNSYTYTGVWGGDGANINTSADDSGSEWYPIDKINGASSISEGQTVTFTFVPSNGVIGTLSVTANGGGDPQNSAKYYIKHPWNGGDWTWKPMERENDDTYFYYGEWGNAGVNISTINDDPNPVYYSLDNNNLIILADVALGKTVIFYYFVNNDVVYVEE